MSIVRSKPKKKRLTYILTFNEPLSPALAVNLLNYSLTYPKHKKSGHVKVKKAVYNPATSTVTLTPGLAFSAHKRNTLTVNGTAPGGLTDLQGRLLDGSDDGKPGSNFLALLTGRQAVTEGAVASVRSVPDLSERAHPVEERLAHARFHPSRPPFTHCGATM